MRAWHRIFLSFLLAVALPVQGWAASTMLWCASTPAHHASSTAAGPATDAHAHHHVQTPADAAGSADAAADATATTDAGSLRQVQRLRRLLHRRRDPAVAPVHAHAADRSQLRPDRAGAAGAHRPRRARTTSPKQSRLIGPAAHRAPRRRSKLVPAPRCAGVDRIVRGSFRDVPNLLWARRCWRPRLPSASRPRALAQPVPLGALAAVPAAALRRHRLDRSDRSEVRRAEPELPLGAAPAIGPTSISRSGRGANSTTRSDASAAGAPTPARLASPTAAPAKSGDGRQ